VVIHTGENGESPTLFRRRQIDHAESGGERRGSNRSASETGVTKKRRAAERPPLSSGGICLTSAAQLHPVRSGCRPALFRTVNC
jgi:hypothetical protein